MNILLLSTGGGGGNIVRSVRSLFHRDVAVAQQSDAGYAERLLASVTTCCIDTNEFSLADLPSDERLLIGARTTGRLGARHNPDVAREALEESRSEVEALIGRHAVIVLVGSGGKGTGAGTIFPLAEIARRRKKLLIPVFVRPSFERHEVDKRRYDHALTVSQQFDAAQIRLVEVLNDRGYTDADPKPQATVWERMNLPIARGLRGLIYVLWDLSQVDPSDLSTLFAGPGRLRIGFGEIDPPADREPDEGQIEQAVHECWDNPYYRFSKPAGTSLICIQGEWSNVVDARIKGRLATLALGGKPDSPYNPLSARAVQSPRPWGVTALFAEHTGAHAPLEIDWPLGRIDQPAAVSEAISLTTVPVETIPANQIVAASATPAQPDSDDHGDENAGPHLERRPVESDRPPFAGLWEFAVAVNRSDPGALALAGNGVNAEIAVDGLEVRKLVGMVWFRDVVSRLSGEWRARLLDALVATTEVPNHAVRIGRRAVRLREMSYEELRDFMTISAPEAVRPDVELLKAVGRFWGAEAIGRLRFIEGSDSRDPSGLMGLLQGFRS